MTAKRDFSPYFLGAYAENNDIFESIWLEFFREHAYWRRSFHPEDVPPIKPSKQFQPEFLDNLSKTKQSLHKLSAKLKQSVPFYHPRYIGHMSSDLLMPGVLAQMVTTLYNPNNVSTEAAPVTVEMEKQYGETLADMFGMNTDPESGEVAFGHLTSGGTVANYQSVWYARAIKYYPLALSAALTDAQQSELKVDGVSLSNFTPWQLFNLTFDQTIALRETLFKWLKEFTQPEQRTILKSISEARIEHLGPVDFFAQFPQLKQPVLLVPTTGHYSWQKSAKILGLGTRQLVSVKTDDKMRISVSHLQQLLTDYAQQEQPVLALVGVLGTTEFGTIDPVHQLVELRETFRQQGLEFFIHIDAAWGGFMSAMFRDNNNQLINYQQVREGFKHFPSENLYQSFAALSQVETITVDPHKLGYLPFGVGAFVCRNKGARGFVVQDAPYVFDGDKYSVPEPELGQYIFEGSKPGSMAAAVTVASEVLPYNAEGLGELPRQTIIDTEYFYNKVQQVADELSDSFKLIIPIEPDSNLICLAVNPVGNTNARVMNQLVNKLYNQLKVDPNIPLQNKAFFASSTKIFRRYLSNEAASSLCDNLGLDANSFAAESQNADCSDHLMVLRHTLMNPWLSGDHGNYIDQYLEYLVQLVASTK